MMNFDFVCNALPRCDCLLLYFGVLVDIMLIFDYFNVCFQRYSDFGFLARDFS